MPIKHHIAMAWALINGLELNGMVRVGTSEVMRFSLIDADGCATTIASEAAYLFDVQLGRAFLPQADSDWLDQLMTRFRVGTQWREDIGAWSATVQRAVGYGQTPGIAVVEALVAACRGGCPPAKYPYPGSE